MIAQNVLGIIADEFAHIPSSGSQNCIVRNLHRADEIDKVDKVVDSRDAAFGVSRVAADAGDIYLKCFGALGSRHHGIVGGFAHEQIFGACMCLCKMLCSKRAGFLAGEEQQSEIAVAALLEHEASLIERPNLPFGIASASAAESFAVELWSDVGRHGVEVRAEHYLRVAPTEEQVERAVAHLHDFYRALRCDEFLGEKLSQLALLR